MATITLSPELSERVEKAAERRGTTAENLITQAFNTFQGPGDGLPIAQTDGLPGVSAGGVTAPAPTEEDSPEVLAALANAQAIAGRINLRLDSIHGELQASIISVREAHETATAIRQVTGAANAV